MANSIVYQIIGTAPGQPTWRDGKVYRHREVAQEHAAQMNMGCWYHVVIPLTVVEDMPPSHPQPQQGHPLGTYHGREY